MSKKFIAFCLMTMMLICLVFASSYAVENNLLSTSGTVKFYDGANDLRIGAFEGVENLYAKINFTPSQTGNVDIFIASYGAGKILKGVKIVSDIPVAAGIPKEYTTEKISTEDAESIMVYVWNSQTIRPVVKTPGIIGKTGVSEIKFVSTEKTLVINEKVTLGELFAVNEGIINEIDDASVVVEASEGVTYVADTSDWTKGTVEAANAGEITLTVYDNFLCEKTTATFTVVAPGAEFTPKFTNDYLYKVGNQNTVALGSLFTADSEVKDISVVVESVDKNIGVSGVHTDNADWTKGTIKFEGTGVVKVTVRDGDIADPTEIYLEVVDAKNITASAGATANNVVLLNDITSGGFSVSNGYTFYGNGFKVTCAGDGAYSSKLLTQGYVYVTNGGILEDTQIICDIFPKAYLFTNEMSESGTDRYPYAKSAVVVGGDSVISGCYIHGARTNIYVNTGNVIIKDTVTEGGSLANIHIDKSSDVYTVSLDNVTTIQSKTTSKYDESAVVLGMGVLVGNNESLSNPAIKLTGALKQYNWVSSHDSDISNTYAQTVLDAALSNTNYTHTINGTTYANLGIVYLNGLGGNIFDERNENEPAYYKDTVKITMLAQTVNGQVYSVKAGSGITAEAGFNAETDGVIPYALKTAELYKPQFVLSNKTLGGQYIENTDGCDEYCYVDGNTVKVMFVTGDTAELDLASMVSLSKYSGQDLGLNITVTDSEGNPVSITDNKLTLSEQKNYIVTYSITDSLFYDKDGNAVSGSINYSWDVGVSVSTKDVSVPDAEITFDTSKQKVYNDETAYFGTGDYVQMVQFLDGLRIYDYIGQEKYLRFNGDTDFNKIARVTVGNPVASGGANIHTVTIELIDGGVLYVDVRECALQGGSSTHSGSVFVGDLDGDGNKNLVFANDGKTSQVGYTWYIPRYEFKGNNGVSVKTSLNPFGDLNNYGTDDTKPTAKFSTTINAAVSFEANGGSCVQTIGYATSLSTAVTLPAATRSGYVFVGWFTAESGGTFIGKGGASYTPSGNITLYAQWGKVSTVTYNANGGTCSVTTDTFTGDAIVLPSATKVGMAHIGWYTAPEGGERVGAAGESYVPTGDITLYAQWATPPTVTYNANGGSCPETSATYTDTALTLPTPTRSGYRFTGWYTAASGGIKAGDADAAYTPSADITLYAQWIQQYTVTYNANGGSVSPTSATCDAGESVKLPTPTKTSNSFNGWYTASSGGTKVGAAGASYKPEASITLYAQWTKDSCVAGDTLVNMADGSKKRIDEVTYEDVLLSWNFIEGKYDAVPASVIFYHGDKEYRILNLNFSDGTKVKVIDNHGFFSVAENNFVNIDENNVERYIGQEFVKVSDGKNISVKLSGYEITNEYTGMYSIQTAMYINFLVEDMLSITRPPLEGWFDYFEIGDNMKYDEAKMKADIEKYGLYEYEEFSEFVTYEQFMAFNGPYLKVLVGRGVLSREKIFDLIELYVAPLQNK